MPDGMLIPPLCAALFLAAAPAVPAGRLDGTVIVSLPPEYTFGREMRFSANILSSEAPSSARLYLREGFSRILSYPAEIVSSEGWLLTARRDLAAEPVFPFASVEYWWEADLSSGGKAESPRQSIQYADDRFAWERLERSGAVVHWTEGGFREAGDAAELIRLALETESVELQATIPETVRLYIYPRLADLHFAVGGRLGGWEGAVSDPASGIILLAAASGAEGRRPLAALLGHEVAHVLLGAKWGSAYELLPLWLVEGTAVGYESEERPESNRILSESAADGILIPLRALCTAFPAEETPALLAYAESGSFVAYLKRTFGSEVLPQLAAAYAGGADCVGAPQDFTGKTLDELDSDWRKTLTPEEAPLPPAWIPVLAGAVLLAGVLSVRMLIGRRSRQTGGAGRKQNGG
jgi:hypothetical protein